MTIDHQQDLGLALLRALNALGHSAFIAGGAPRDWYMGSVAKDLDIFVYYEDSKETTDFHVDHQAHNLKNSLLFLNCDDVTLDPTNLYFGLNGVRCVINVKDYDVPVQVIFINRSAVDTINEFPASVSKVWMQPDRSLNMHPQFWLGEKLKAVIVDEFIREPYLKRLKEKFNHRTFITNDTFGSIKEV